MKIIRWVAVLDRLPSPRPRYRVGRSTADMGEHGRWLTNRRPNLR